MYKIIGSDQKEYGPVSSGQIQQWIALGRVNAQTKTQLDGGEWKTLADFPEFSATLSARRTVPATGAPPMSAQPQKTNGLAIASLILGVLGFLSCGATALIGLILGIVSMNQVRKSNSAQGGGGIALAGTIVSAVSLLFIPIGAAMLLPALAAAKGRAMTIQCLNNARQLSQAARLYAGDHKDHFPEATNWCDALKTYVGDTSKVYKCPAANTLDGCDYTYNAQVAGLEISSVNPETVLLFESKDGWNLSGGSDMLLSEPRHGNRGRMKTVTVAFADGHVEELTQDRIRQLRWEP